MLPMYIMGTTIRTAGMVITTDTTGTAITITIDTIGTDGITTRNSNSFDEPSSWPLQAMSWRAA